MTESVPDPVDVDERTGLEILGRSACIALLENTPIGRVVFVDDSGQPLALPVNFRWHEESVVFRTLDGQKLQAALMNKRVSFEVDQWDPVARTGSSVIVKGKAAAIDQWAEREQLEQIGLTPWSEEKWRTTWVRVTPVEITGRRTR